MDKKSDCGLRTASSKANGPCTGRTGSSFPTSPLPPSSFRPRNRGVTLTEVIVCIPLVGVVLVGAMNTTGAIVKTWTDSGDHHRGLALAEELMTEILSQYYEEPVDTPALGREGTESVGSRSNYDDVDDYHGWYTPAIKNRAGTVHQDCAGWARGATVEYVQLADPGQSNATDQDLKRITVTVTDPAGNTTVLVGYRSRSGARETPPATEATLLGFITHQLRVSGISIYGGAHLSNHARDE